MDVMSTHHAVAYSNMQRPITGVTGNMETAHTITPAGTVETPAATQPIEAPARQPQPAQERLQERTRRPRTGAYDKAGQSLAYFASGLLSIALWYAGAYFTIAALKSFGINASGPVWWLIPGAITVIEIWLMPRAGVRWQAVSFFAVVLLADVLSSWYGVVATLGGRFLPLGAGWTIPESGPALQIGAIAISLIFAFMPERLARWSISELWKVWK